MPIEMPKGLSFSVDTWNLSSTRKRHHFLTHAHMDHLQGIAAHGSYPIYCSLLTKNLLRMFFPQLDESMFICIEVGESRVVEDRDGDFLVAAFDAYHCPGALMFLFEGKFGNILHTGDCRLTPECLQNLPGKYFGNKGKTPECRLDCIFLDCTFGKFHLDMPSRHDATRQVINCIWDHPDAPNVYLGCDLLGQEDILLLVSSAFGEKIYIDPTKNPKCFKTFELIAPEIISQDVASRFHLLGFPGLYETAEIKINEARSNLQPEPLVIRPSSQWYAWDEGFSDTMKRTKERTDRAVKDVNGIWHVCYSIHSSRDELEWALELLAPKWVVSTTVSCRAMEFDYVRKHCFSDQRAVKESVSKLIGFGEVDSLDSGEISDSSDHLSDDFTDTPFEEPVVLLTTNGRKRLSLSPPGKGGVAARSVTLFGRARNGMLDFQSEAEIVLEKTETSKCSSTSVIEARNGMPEFQSEVEIKEEKIENPKCTAAIQTGDDDDVCCSSVSKRSCYGEEVRKIYRRMNVPIPRRLPSLVKLMDGLRSVKRKEVNRT